MNNREITPSTKVELGLVGSIVVSIIWLLTHLLPTEAKVEQHDAQLSNLEKKTDMILEDTNYIRGKLNMLEKHR